MTVLCLMALALITSCVGAQENLLKNPDFEDGIGANVLPVGGWWVYESEGVPKVTVDATVAHQGSASIMLAAKDQARFTVVSAPFPVTPFDEIRFEGYIRAHDLRGGKDPIGIALSFRDAGGKVFDRNFVYPAKPLSGTWTSLSGVAKVPANAVTGEVFLQFNRASGTAWFDSISAVTVNTVSMTLADSAKPYVGEQTITALVANRSDSPLTGSLRLTLDKQVSDVPISVGTKSESRIPLTINLKAVGSHDYSLELLSASGLPERNVTGKFSAIAPLIVYPACPCYHAIGEGDSSTRMDVQVNLHPARLSGARLQIQVADSAGKVLDTASVDASNGGLVGHAFKVPVDSMGDFLVTIKLLDANGKQIGDGQADIHVRSRTDSQVIMGADGYPRVSGKLQFPLGLYSAGRFPEMAQAGFSYSHNYGITTGEADALINPNDIRLKELLDRNAEAGITMMVELPRKAIEKGRWEQIRRRIETFRNHPGLGYWGSEERVARGEGPLKNIAGAYRIVKELDPNHPFVLGDTRDVITKLKVDRSFFFPESMMDVGIWWYYPIPMEANPDEPAPAKKRDLTFIPPSWLTDYTGDKPLWIAIQCYKHPRIDGRYPTRAEYRQMCYMPIVYGAKGIAFYTGSGQLDYYKKASGILNNPEQGDWEYVKQLIREMRDLDSVLTATTVSGKIAKAPADSSVDFIVKDQGGKLAVIAVNRAKKTIRMRFAGAGITGSEVSVHNENRTVRVTGDAFTDVFEPYAVHIYMIGR